jgi:superoxide reductase
VKTAIKKIKEVIIMTNFGDLYYCKECGHVVFVAVPGAPTLVCCGEKMTRLEAKTHDAGREKHVPVIIPNGDTTTIKIGSAPHPMTKEHHIEFIEVVRKDGKTGMVKLDPMGAPEATFNMKAEDIEAVYEFCNIHGLWKA